MWCDRSRIAALAGLLMVFAAGAACSSGPAPVDQLSRLPESRLSLQMRWLDRTPRDAAEAFGEAGREAYIEAVRAEILERHPEWPKDVCKAIRGGRVELGMTPQQVVAAIGLPNEWPGAWWDAYAARPHGFGGGDALAYKSARYRLQQWSYGQAPQNLWVFYEDGRVYRIRDNRTGRDDAVSAWR